MMRCNAYVIQCEDGDLRSINCPRRCRTIDLPPISVELTLRETRLEGLEIVIFVKIVHVAVGLHCTVPSPKNVEVKMQLSPAPNLTGPLAQE